jgi:H+/Cl- antiporter ClcA
MTFFVRKDVVPEKFSGPVATVVIVASLLGILATFIRWWAITGQDISKPTRRYDHAYGAAQMTIPLLLCFVGLIALAMLSVLRHEPLKGRTSALFALVALLGSLVGYFVSYSTASDLFRRATGGNSANVSNPSQGFFLCLVCSIVLCVACFRVFSRQRRGGHVSARINPDPVWG